MTKARVIIEQIQPVLDAGRYPARRTKGESVEVTATIFGDGHDHIRAAVLYRKESDASWNSTEMMPLYNDGWTGSFIVSETEPYLFRVKAWIDHFETWYDGFKKKAAA